MTAHRLVPAVLAAVAAGTGAALLATSAGAGGGSTSITRQGTAIEINGSGDIDHLTVAGSSADEITVSSDTGQVFGGLSGGTCTAADAGSMTQECSATGLTRMEVGGNDSADVLSIPGQFTIAVRATGDAGADTVIGGPSEETQVGGSGGDRLRGAGGEDELLGKAGKDNLNGGTGSDGCSGGKGADKVKRCERAPDPAPPID